MPPGKLPLYSSNFSAWHVSYEKLQGVSSPIGYRDLNEFSFSELAALQSFIWSKNCFSFMALCAHYCCKDITCFPQNY
jgi:hypothetical protein